MWGFTSNAITPVICLWIFPLNHPHKNLNAFVFPTKPPAGMPRQLRVPDGCRVICVHPRILSLPTKHVKALSLPKM